MYNCILMRPSPARLCSYHADVVLQLARSKLVVMPIPRNSVRHRHMASMHCLQVKHVLTSFSKVRRTSLETGQAKFPLAASYIRRQKD